MLEEVMRLPRKSPESTDLHRWAMLRMAFNEHRCVSLVNVVKKKKKKPKEQPKPMATLFSDLPSMTAVRTWKSKIGGNIRQKYGGGVEWASGLTDSAYLMYGIPRATLKQEHLSAIKQRHLRKNVNPRSINYSQSFSEYATPSQLEVSDQPRDRHSTAGHSIESSVSSLSSAPSSPGAPSPQPARVPHHLPPNSVSVLPRNNPKLVSLNHVDANLDLYSSKGALVSARTKLEPNPEQDSRRNSTGMLSPSRLSPNSEVVRSPLVPSIVENKVKEEEHKEEDKEVEKETINNNNVNTCNGVDTNKNDTNNDNNNNLPAEKLTSSLEDVPVSPRTPTPPTIYIPEAPRIESARSPLNTLQRPVIIGQYNNNNASNNNNNIFAEIDATQTVVVCHPIPPAPKIPINKRPPQPAPKPKNRRPHNNKFNMAPLQAALIGSLNKRFKAPKITT